MDLQSVLNRAWDLIKEVKVRLEQARENKDQCQQIRKHIAAIEGPLRTIQGSAQSQPEIQNFVKNLVEHLEETQALLTGMVGEGHQEQPKTVGGKLLAAFAKLGKNVRGAWNANDNVKILKTINQQFSYLNEQATVVIMSKLLSGQRVISMAYKKHWEVDVCEDMSNFCLLTKNRDVVITAGKYSHKISWEIFAYHFDAEAKGLETQWTFELSEEFGQPLDIAEVDLQDEADKQYLAVLQEDPNQIWLFDPDNKTLFDKPVYTTPDKYRMRSMVYAGSYQLAVALDPVGSAAQDEDLKSQIHVLHCEKKGLADLGGDNPRTDLDGEGTRSLVTVPDNGLAVVMTRPSNVIQTLPLQRDALSFTRLRVSPIKIEDNLIRMSQVVSVGHDLCVVDNQHNSCRVFGLHADQGGAKWKQLFDDRAKLGSIVYGIAYLPPTQLIFLHDLNNRNTITIFDLQFGN